MQDLWIINVRSLIQKDLAEKGRAPNEFKHHSDWETSGLKRSLWGRGMFFFGDLEPGVASAVSCSKRRLWENAKVCSH